MNTNETFIKHTGNLLNINAKDSLFLFSFLIGATRGSSSSGGELSPVNSPQDLNSNEIDLPAVAKVSFELI